MPMKTVVLTFKDVENVTDDPTVVFIRMSTGWTLVLPKAAVEGMEMTISDQPETTPENKP